MVVMTFDSEDWGFAAGIVESPGNDDDKAAESCKAKLAVGRGASVAMDRANRGARHCCKCQSWSSDRQ
jgi:hypothetical protein